MSVKSALRVLEIIELLADHDQGLTINEISDNLSFPQSSTFNIIQTMLSQGYLSKSSEKRYKLGSKLIRIGTRALASFNLQVDVRPYLQRLMEKVEETVFMAILSDQELVYIAKVDNNRSIRTSAEIGGRKPLYCTGLGKAFLAFLPKIQRDELLQNTDFKAIAPKTITDRHLLNEQLSNFQEMGYAIDDEESEEGLYCYATPIFDSTGQIASAISVAGPKERITRNSDRVVSELMKTSHQISESLGYFR